MYRLINDCFFRNKKRFAEKEAELDANNPPAFSKLRNVLGTKKEVIFFAIIPPKNTRFLHCSTVVYSCLFIMIEPSVVLFLFTGCHCSEIETVEEDWRNARKAVMVWKEKRDARENSYFFRGLYSMNNLNIRLGKD